MTDVQDFKISLCHRHFYDVATAIFDHPMSTTMLQPSQQPIHSYDLSMSRDVKFIENHGYGLGLAGKLFYDHSTASK